ncbi:uncharacterized protein [Triticum aestivum]|uniref:uncharacterized protein isoform X2 n=2 Tax=Triticum TaxID=4564 RepID=UPI001D02B4D0|nr:uncharacterized protein LOC123092020 isoform X2 [Triticum aestivum]
MPAREADRVASIVNTAAAPPPTSVHEEASGGGEPSLRGSRRRRNSTVCRRPEKEEGRGCQPGRRIDSPSRLERVRCVHLGSGELIWGTLEICFLYIGHGNSSPDILQWLPTR